MRVLVLGGAGFIGRHVVAALRERGHDVVIGSRRAAVGDRERRRVRVERAVTPDAWHAALRDIDVVVNAVGILRERPGESYDAVHHRGPAALARACGELGIRRLVHVSALGLSGARHPFMRSKADGEAAIHAACPLATIVRPSLLDGAGGFGARWIRRVARWPVHALPVQATGAIAALDVRDVGEAIATLCEAPAAEALRFAELGGVDVRTFAEHLDALRAAAGRASVRRVAVPALVARIAARVCDALHVSPFSAGHLELMTRDNVPRPNALPALLGRAPVRVGAIRAMRARRPAIDGVALG